MSLRIKEDSITNLEFEDSVLSGSFKQLKQGRLDLLVEINHDKLVNIEFQNSDNKNTTERFTWYLCNKYVDSLKQGEDYASLNKIYGIYLLNYDDKNYPNFFSKYESRDIMNKKTTAKSMINMSLFNLKQIDKIENYEFSEEQKDLIRFIKSENSQKTQEIKETES